MKQFINIRIESELSAAEVEAYRSFTEEQVNKSIEEMKKDLKSVLFSEGASEESIKELEIKYE